MFGIYRYNGKETGWNGGVIQGYKHISENRNLNARFGGVYCMCVV